MGTRARCSPFKMQGAPRASRSRSPSRSRDQPPPLPVAPDPLARGLGFALQGIDRRLREVEAAVEANRLLYQQLEAAVEADWERHHPLEAAVAANLGSQQHLEETVQALRTWLASMLEDV